MSWFYKRIQFALKQTGNRFLRIFQWQLNKDMQLPVVWYSIPFWFILITFTRILELFFIFDLYEISYYFYNKKILKQLNDNQLEVITKIFTSIDLNLVLRNPHSYVSRKVPHIIYVAFNIIKYKNSISKTTLVHEMMHIYQYQKYGASYIIYALLAQKSKSGYNYGGLQKLIENNALSDFNAEQQAEIIEDYYRLQNGIRPQWITNDVNLEVFNKYLQSLI
jgi:hypothetical protein